MAEAPSARYVIGFDADTSGVDQSKSALDSLRASIERDAKALGELKASMDRLKGTAEVTRWEALPKDIGRAESEIAKLSAKMAKLKTDFEKAPEGKREGIFAAALQTQGELNSATARLSAFRSEQKRLSTSEPVKLFEDMRLRAEQLKDTLGRNQTAFSRMGGSMSDAGNETAKAADTMQSLSAGAEMAGVNVGGITGKFKALAALGPAGLIALAVAAVVGLTVALGVAVVKATAFAISMSDAARSAGLLREATARAGKASSEELKGAILAIEGRTAASREAITGLVSDYAKLGLSLGAIQAASQAVTVAQQTMGEGAASTLKGLIDRGVDTKRFWLGVFDLKGTGLSFKEVATTLSKQMGVAVGAAEAALRQGRVKLEDGVKALDAAMQAKFGDIARSQMLALPVQLDRLKKSFGAVFTGVNLDSFLGKMDTALGLLRETEVVGKALKQIASLIFQPLADSAGDSFPIVEGFILGVTLALQELTKLGLKAAISLKKTFGDSELFKNMDLVEVGAYAGAIAVGGLVVAVGVLAVAMGVLGVSILLASLPLLVLAAAAVAIGYGIAAAADSVHEGAMDIMNTIVGIGKSIKDFASNIVDGLVEGIKGGIPAFVKGLQSLAESGLKAFKKALGISSPSKAFKAEARWIPEGTAEGVEEGRPRVAQALATLASPDDLGTGQTVNTTSDRSITLVINYYGRGSRADASELGEDLIDILERHLFAKGLPA